MRDPIDAAAGMLSKLEWVRRGQSEQLAEYRIAVGLNMIGVILFTALLGACWHRYAEALIAMVCFFSLRAFSGGFHFRSLTLCWAVTVTLFVLTAFAELSALWTSLLNAAALLLVLGLAPRNVPNVPAFMHRYMKVFAVIVVGLNFFWQNDQAAVSFAAQALLLLPRERR